MSEYKLTQEQFLKDVADHQMTVIRDDGVSRHIRFRDPNTSCMHFDLITWPGCLCYTGDMGTYVFQRLRDMFEFFRTDRRDDSSKLYINLSYWTEKLIAVDGNRGGKVKEFDEDKFRQVINEYRVQWMRDAKESGSLNKEGRRELWEAVDDEVLCYLHGSAEDTLRLADAFNYRPVETTQGRSNWYFKNIFDHDMTEYTHRIVWCCYAMAWGIKQYDLSKEVVVAA